MERQETLGTFPFRSPVITAAKGERWKGNPEREERNKPWTEGVFAVLTAEPTEETYEIVQRWQRLVQEFLCLQLVHGLLSHLSTSC